MPSSLIVEVGPGDLNQTIKLLGEVAFGLISTGMGLVLPSIYQWFAPRV